MFFLVGGAAMGAYARFAKGYNNLWLIGAFIPLVVFNFYNWARQPQQELENCYKYLLTKRAATCEMEINKKKFDELKESKAG